MLSEEVRSFFRGELFTWPAESQVSASRVLDTNQYCHVPLHKEGSQDLGCLRAAMKIYGISLRVEETFLNFKKNKLNFIEILPKNTENIRALFKNQRKLYEDQMKDCENQRNLFGPIGNL